MTGSAEPARYLQKNSRDDPHADRRASGTTTETAMPMNWITTATSLPSEGATVEFMLDERKCPMRGRYALGRFESRWTCYEPASVRQWRMVSKLPASIVARIAPAPGVIRMHAA